MFKLVFVDDRRISAPGALTARGRSRSTRLAALFGKPGAVTTLISVRTQNSLKVQQIDTSRSFVE